MKPESLLPHSQQPATSPYPDPNQSSPYFPFPLLEDPLYYYSPIYAYVLHVLSFPQVFPPTLFMHFWCLPNVPHAPPISFFLSCPAEQYLVKQYRSQSSSLCSFLHSPATSSFLGLNMFFSTLLSNALGLCSSLHLAWGKLRKLWK